MWWGRTRPDPGLRVTIELGGGKVGTQSADYAAFAKDGHKPVVVPLSQMVVTASGAVTEVGPWVTMRGCVSPPANFDLSKATDQERTLYGFPTVGNIPRAICDQKYGWMRPRDCQARATNSPPHSNLSALTNVNSG